MPDHFLHVAVGVADDLEVDEAKRAWCSVEPFELVYRRANSFHEAAILEVHGEGVRALVERAFPKQDLSLLLPHLSIGYVKQSETGEQLRSALRPFRDVDLGRGVVDEIFLCEVPFARSTFLQPWRVVDSIKLRHPRPH